MVKKKEKKLTPKEEEDEFNFNELMQIGLVAAHGYMLFKLYETNPEVKKIIDKANKRTVKKLKKKSKTSA